MHVWLAVCMLLGGLFPQLAAAQNYPAKPSPPKLVNDYADILTPEQEAHLEELLVNYDNQSSVQIAVVTLKKLDGYDAGDYAVGLGREWGVGNKTTNNGVVVLVSTEPGKRKVFIAPGYGLEARLTDYTCRTIVEAEILPLFKQEQYYRGLEKGATSIIEATKGAYTAPEGYAKRGKKGEGGGIIVFMIIIFILVIVFFGNRGGGGGGDAMTRRGHRHMDRVPPFIFFPPSGGGGGGGFGGFGGGGGGFGGFGGGGFGGGGAGGSW